MIKVTIELDRFGAGTDVSTLGTLTISNTARGTYTRGEYIYKLFGKSGQLLKTGLIENWPRQERLACDLVAACLIHARGEKTVSG